MIACVLKTRSNPLQESNPQWRMAEDIKLFYPRVSYKACSLFYVKKYTYRDGGQKQENQETKMDAGRVERSNVLFRRHGRICIS